MDALSFARLREEVSALGYGSHPVGIESAPLVRALLDDLVHATAVSQSVSGKSGASGERVGWEARLVHDAVAAENSRLVGEANALHQTIVHLREEMGRMQNAAKVAGIPTRDASVRETELLFVNRELRRQLGVAQADVARAERRLAAVLGKDHDGVPRCVPHIHIISSQRGGGGGMLLSSASSGMSSASSASSASSFVFGNEEKSESSAAGGGGDKGGVGKGGVRVTRSDSEKLEALRRRSRSRRRGGKGVPESARLDLLRAAQNRALRLRDKLDVVEGENARLEATVASMGERNNALLEEVNRLHDVIQTRCRNGWGTSPTFDNADGELMGVIPSLELAAMRRINQVNDQVIDQLAHQVSVLEHHVRHAASGGATTKKTRNAKNTKKTRKTREARKTKTKTKTKTKKVGGKRRKGVNKGRAKGRAKTGAKAGAKTLAQERKALVDVVEENRMLITDLHQTQLASMMAVEPLTPADANQLYTPMFAR